MTRKILRMVAMGFAACIAAGGSAALASTGSATLRWTAPGDDGHFGRALGYDLRYSLTPITVTNFALATPVSGVPAPRTAGSPEVFTVTNLAAGKTFYFAIKTVDEAANWSPISNIIFYSVQTTAVGSEPLTLWLSPPSPNPARDVARWSYSLPQEGPIDVEVFDLSGRHVRNIARRWSDAGRGELAWDLRDDGGRSVPVGVYMVSATLGGQRWMKRLVVTH